MTKLCNVNIVKKNIFLVFIILSISCHLDNNKISTIESEDDSLSTVELTGSFEDAILSVDLELIEAFLKKGQDPNIEMTIIYNDIVERKREILVLDYVVYYLNNVELLELLLEYGAIIPSNTFVNCAYNAWFQMFEVMLNSGYDPNTVDHKGDTALHKVIGHTHSKVKYTRMLLKYGADPNIRNLNGNTPIQTTTHCLYDVFEELLPILIEYNTDLNNVNNLGWTVLYTCVNGPQSDKLDLLINYGLDLKIQDQSGQLALKLPIYYIFNYEIPEMIDNGIKVVDLLLRNGSNINLQETYDNPIPNWNTNPNITSVKGFSLLHYAVVWNSIEAIEYLISKGINKNLISEDGLTASELAFELGNYDLFERLSDN